MVNCCVAFARLEDIALADATSHVQEGLHCLKVCLCDLLCLVLFDLIEAQKGLFGLELAFQGVEKELLLVLLRLAIIERFLELNGASAPQLVLNIFRWLL